MTEKNTIKLIDLNGGRQSDTSSPSQLSQIQPAIGAGFSFMGTYGAKTGPIKHFTYKPAKLYSRGKKWYVYYSFRIGEKMHRFKVYEEINRIKDPLEKREYGNKLKFAVNNALESGYDPTQKLEVIKTWTLVQGINYFKQNLHERGLRKRTIQTYESVLRMMYGWEDLLLTEINSVTKLQVASALKNPTWANTTFNNNLTFVRSIFNYLIEAGIMEKNPAASVKMLPKSVTKNRYFDDQTFEKIKKNASPVLFRFLMFLYHTGTRPNEARQLKYEHIDPERKLLMVPASISKNKKDDYVPLSDYIIDNFKGEGFIFGTSANHFTKAFNNLKIKLNLPKEMNLYSIKATRAIHLAQDGASPYAIMQLFRHHSLEMTMHYLSGLGLTVNREAADKAR
jgi:integrase